MEITNEFIAQCARTEARVPAHADVRAMVNAEAVMLESNIDLVTVDADMLARDLANERLIGEDDLVDESFMDLALVAARPVGRLALTRDGKSVFATGFMVSPSLLMTNHHVFRALDDVQGFIEFDFRTEMDLATRVPSRFRLDGRRFFWTHEPLDVSLVAVEPLATDSERALTDFGYHRLIAAKEKVPVGRPITIIQHPRGKPRQIAVRENTLKEYVDANWMEYLSDTAQGSSGSPAFSDAFQLAALHSHGSPKKEGNKFVLKGGRLVDRLVGIDDSEVQWESNVGARISAICALISATALADASGSERKQLVDELVRSSEGRGDVISIAHEGGTKVMITNGRSASRGLELDEPTETVRRASSPPPPRSSRSETAPTPVPTGTFEIEVPLRISVSIGSALAPAPDSISGPTVDLRDRTDNPDVELDEAFVEPKVDGNYSKRAGYDPDFLGVKVPLPTTRLRSLARMKNGESEIPYEHFSAVISAPRRLALFVASNVDWSAAMRGDWSRKDLNGFIDDNDREAWITDPRIDAQAQLPDVFYNEDGTAFDKGHLVRRDDVCWGPNKATVQRANGDTFHTTNCSPQAMVFNRSNKGTLNWGDLENLVQKNGKKEKYSIFAGPLLEVDDPVFRGWDDMGSVPVQIPRAYWKVVVAVENGELKAWAFVIEQDLSDIEFEELDVPTEWKARQWTIKRLESKLHVKFPKQVHDADTKR